MSNLLLEAALKYRFKYNWSVIPLSPGSKIPPKGFEVIPFRDRLATKEEIFSWWKENPNYNIGIITGKLSNLFVVDLDKYKPEYSEETVLKYIPDNIETPIDKSPRGGEHLYFNYPTDSDPTIHADTLPAVDYRGEGGYILAPPSVVDSKSSSWVVPPNGKPLSVAPSAFMMLLKSINNKYNRGGVLGGGINNQELNNVKDVKNCYIYSMEGTRDQDLFHAGHLLFNGNATEKEMAFILNILAKTCEPEYPENEVNIKIQSIIKRSMRKERNVSQEVREWSLLNNVSFLLKDCYNELKLVKKDEMTNARVTMNAMVKEGIIQKDEYVRGKYSVMRELEESIIDLDAADNTSLPIKFPLGIHELVKIMPKNIIIVAGESNAGKSAFLLNVAARNMVDHPVFYFSSEMGGAELKERLQNFNEKMPFNMWKHCTFIERSIDFDIAIRPDAINIIDFLEIHDEFYKIGGFIKKIFDKLNNGIAIIAIQKNKGRDDGLGGARSIEKARLYLSISPGTIKIVKAKNWISPMVNPNGMQKDFKLAKGMIFTEDKESRGRWEKIDG